MSNTSHLPLLSQINSPDDLRNLSESDLEPVCSELREFLIDTIALTGGHLGASLGTVELTVALHYAFNTPHDRLIWDVGHQAYPHKILTNRRDKLKTIRTKEGLAGFPKREESQYDAFGVGHSSTSISAAMGMALAAHSQGIDRKCIAVIGDGAMTAGMAFEALNHAGDRKANVLVILNDNDMSISPNVGALNKYLVRILSGKLFSSARESGKRVLNHIPPIAEFARRTEEHVKGMVVPGTLFEELGFQYFGPVDGHDVITLTKVLSNLSHLNGPILLHVITKKGKGYKFAEEDALALHAVTPFDPATGKTRATNKNKGLTYTEVFGQWICDMAKSDNRLFGITPAMREGSGMVDFSKQYPDRFLDVAIAEQHAVTLAAGLATENQKPVVAIYSTFLQRAYDQLVHDVALQNLSVLFAIDRSGLVGPDGPTHAGSFDFSYLRCIPNMLIMAPSDENECRQMLYTGFKHKGPAAVRYPRSTGPGVKVHQQMVEIEVGKAQIKQTGINLVIFAFGSMVKPSEEAGKLLDATVVNMRFVKPLDEDIISSLAKKHRLFVTVEENSICGGAGSAISEYANANNISVPILHLGIPDYFQEHGSREELLEECGLSISGIVSSIQKYSKVETPDIPFPLSDIPAITVQ